MTCTHVPLTDITFNLYVGFHRFKRREKKTWRSSQNSLLNLGKTEYTTRSHVVFHYEPKINSNVTKNHAAR